MLIRTCTAHADYYNGGQRKDIGYRAVTCTAARRGAETFLLDIKVAPATGQVIEKAILSSEDGLERACKCCATDRTQGTTVKPHSTLSVLNF